MEQTITQKDKKQIISYIYNDWIPQNQAQLPDHGYGRNWIHGAKSEKEIVDEIRGISVHLKRYSGIYRQLMCLPNSHYNFITKKGIWNFWKKSLLPTIKETTFIQQIIKLPELQNIKLFEPDTTYNCALLLPMDLKLANPKKNIMLLYSI